MFTLIGVVSVISLLTGFALWLGLRVKEEYSHTQEIHNESTIVQHLQNKGNTVLASTSILFGVICVLAVKEGRFFYYEYFPEQNIRCIERDTFLEAREMFLYRYANFKGSSKITYYNTGK